VFRRHLSRQAGATNRFRSSAASPFAAGATTAADADCEGPDVAKLWSLRRVEMRGGRFILYGFIRRRVVDLQLEEAMSPAIRKLEAVNVPAR
jgi:hypothetical protein